MRLLVLDNYDSFTYNLAHLVEKTSNFDFDVIKNDAIKLEDVGRYDKILLSPGPGLPADAGIMLALIERYCADKSILGVCLGLQGIGAAFSSPLKNLSRVYHGLATPVRIISRDPLFMNCPDEFKVGRYHSWVIDETRLSSELEVTALDEQGLIMAARHKTYDVRGVQFHPESILSEYGETIIKNWLSR